jgi:thiamine biosynthesis lipoprotein
MGTTWSVQITHPPADLDQAALYERIGAELAAVNDRMSTYQADSELSRFNAADTTDWFPVSAELTRLVDTAIAVSTLTDGAFDVTVGPLVNLWGFGPEVKADQLPAQAEIDAALARVGWHLLATRADPPALRKAQADLYVDLSAIAKGYGVDRLADLLEDAGITDYLAEIGGELRGRGLNAAGEPWRIAIERPDAARRAVLRVVALTDLGMATSGDYRNFFELGGKRYSHTIDPVTGRPVDHQLASVTVLAERCAEADAWATALLVLGPERGMTLANDRGLVALFVERFGDELRITESTAFAQMAGG